jgi:hypothetical protein
MTSKEILPVLYEKLAKLEDVKVNVEIGAIVMKSAGVWDILCASKLALFYEHNEDYINYELVADYANNRIGLVDNKTGKINYLIEKPSNDNAIYTLHCKPLHLININKYVGIIDSPTNYVDDISLKTARYVEFTSKVYRCGSTIFNQEANIVAVGWQFKRALNIKKIQHVYVFDGIFAYITYESISVNGNNIKIGDDPRIYSYYTNDVNLDGNLVDSEFTNRIPLKLCKDFVVNVDLPTSAINGDLPAPFGEAFGKDSAPLGETSDEVCEKVLAPVDETFGKESASLDDTYRGYIIPNYKLFTLIYEIDGVWMGYYQSNVYPLCPIKPNSGQNTKPATRAAIEDI